MVFQRRPRNPRPKAKVPLVRTASGRNKKKPVAAAAQEIFVIREVKPSDLDQLYGLARHLNSVNLPENRDVLSETIAQSRASFSGRLEDIFRREYLFVMAGANSGRIAGTSMLFAQHGHPDAPHIYFDVLRDERYSVTLDRHYSHLCLRLGFNYRGPTEIGGLVLDPDLRSFGLGKQLSYVRFLFMAMYRPRFRPLVIAELMPPLLPDGRSELWEYLGRHFTGMTYQEADKLSKTNKEFIISLFPQIPIYASTLPEHVQALIGQVGEETRGVKRMLETIGFEYSECIDPFDGGPHFQADTDAITLVQQTLPVTVAKAPLPDLPAEGSEAIDDAAGAPELARMLVGRGEPSGPCNFRAAAGHVLVEGKSIRITRALRDALGVRAGSPVWAMPL